MKAAGRHLRPVHPVHQQPVRDRLGHRQCGLRLALEPWPKHWPTSKLRDRK